MASKFLVPLHLANLTATPSTNASTGFVKVYIKQDHLKYQDPDGTERDVVLSRPLDGFALSPTAMVVTSADNVLSGFSKLQKSLLSLTLTGDVVGTAQYVGGNLVIQTTVGILNKTLDISDYDYHIQGDRDGLNELFTTRFEFIPDSTKVYLNGVRLTPGAMFDYEEVGPNIVRIYNVPQEDDLLIIDYKTTIP